MEELFELKSYIEQRRYPEALSLIEEMEEMSRDDKINKIGSFIEIFLLHLIKKHAEKRTTRSWEVSMKNALDNIEDVNKRRKAGGYYLNQEELEAIIDRRYQRAMRRASLEAFEGQFDESELAKKVDENQIKKEALQSVISGQ
ncbi:DUF29 family protein [Desulfonema magnum]|uniref:DUF29 n=1 Tax=Desulfonema magnum TaxID=45655 RepID=A0A975BLV2_9BACT|nr:DUF29 family protein [Desulfonema magnum]QTA87863.1 DUF29 [Desulfonema magnum]